MRSAAVLVHGTILPAAAVSMIAWQAGLLACVGWAIIEASGALVAERIRKATPRAALLSTLAGIALGFISLGFLFRTRAHPVVRLATLGVVLLTYFGQVRFKGRLPGGLVAVALGTLLAWATGLAPAGPAPSWTGFALPVPALGPLLGSLRWEPVASYLSVIVPMGLFNVVGSLQNIESAEAASDPSQPRSSMLVQGLGSLAAAFGSPFPTTLYIGHPGWKAMGARAGYSILNGRFITVVALTGTLAFITWAVPIDAGMAIVLWIGLVISAQAFQAVPRLHAPAEVVGLLPAIGARGALMAKSGLRAAGWVGAAAVLSALGLMRSYRYTFGDTAVSLAPSWPHAAGYAIVALLLLAAPFVTEAGRGTEPIRARLSPQSSCCPAWSWYGSGAESGDAARLVQPARPRDPAAPRGTPVRRPRYPALPAGDGSAEMMPGVGKGIPALETTSSFPNRIDSPARARLTRSSARRREVRATTASTAGPIPRSPSSSASSPPFPTSRSFRSGGTVREIAETASPTTAPARPAPPT